MPQTQNMNLWHLNSEILIFRLPVFLRLDNEE